MGSAGGRWETSSSAYGSWWAAQKAEREAQLRLQPPAAALQAAPLGPAGGAPPPAPAPGAAYLGAPGAAGAPVRPRAPWAPARPPSRPLPPPRARARPRVRQGGRAGGREGPTSARLGGVGGISRRQRCLARPPGRGTRGTPPLIPAPHAPHPPALLFPHVEAGSSP